MSNPKPKHTPGPWIIDGQKIRTPGEGSHRVIADLGNPRGQLPSMFEANARLIAAAPELLEALNDLLVKLTELNADGKLNNLGDDGYGLNLLIKNAFDVTEKATGGAE